MKKTLLLLFVLLLVGCTPTSNNQDISIKLVGDKEVTLQLGDTWTDPGASVEGVSNASISTIGEVDTSKIGTYTIVYTYDHEGTIYSVERKVFVEESTISDSATCTLSGDEEINLNIGDTYTDEGYTCTGNTSIIDMDVNNPVDTSQAGTYEIVYNYFNGTDFVEFTRTVHVHDNSLVECTIMGPTSVTLTVGDAYAAPNYSCTGDSSNIDMQIDNQVNTSIAGVYQVIYNYFNGETFVDLIITVTVNEPITNDPVCELDGDLAMTLNEGDLYTEPGYTCTGDTTNLNMQINGTVNTDQEGTYTISYTYMSGGFEYTLYRSVTVISDHFTLNGDLNITLTVGDTWVDPGYSIDNGHEVTIVDTVNTSSPGTYTVSYTYTNTSNVEITLVRTVTVYGTVYYENLEITHDNPGGNLNVITVSLTGVNVNHKYDTYKVELYKDDILHESFTIQEGLNTFTFDNLADYSNYKVYITGTYTVGPDTLTDQSLVGEYTMEPTYGASEVQYGSEDTTHDTYTLDFEVTSGIVQYRGLLVKVYEGSSLVKLITIEAHNTNGTIVVDGLDELTTYTVEIDLLYNDGVTDIQVDSTTKTISTTTNSVPFIYGETPFMYIDESHYAYIEMDGYIVNKITIDGVVQNTIYVNETTSKFLLDTSFEGSHTHAIDSLNITIPGGNTMNITLNTSFSYYILSSSETVQVPVLLDIYNKVELNTTNILTTDKYQLEVKFNNPDLHSIEITAINGLPVDLDDTFTGTELSFSYESYGFVEITEFMYTYGGMNFYEVPTNYNKEHLGSCGTYGLQDISTPAELVNMLDNPYGCFQLTNDIDMSGVSWYTVLNRNITDTQNLSLYGNGYTISNLSISNANINYGRDSSWGLFGELNNAHIEDLNIILSINIGNQNYTYNPLFTIGGLAGSAYNSHIENVHISGTINSPYIKRGNIGGLIGYVENSTITECTTDISISLTTYQDSDSLEYTYVGGLVGQLIGSNVELSGVHNYANGPSSHNGQVVVLGGVFGQTENSSITDTYFDAGQTSQLQGQAQLAGGIAGQSIGTSFKRVYNLESVYTDGFRAAGFISYGITTTIEDSFIGAITINGATQVGLIYSGYDGLNGVVATDVYIDDSAITYVSGAIGNGYDYNHSQLTYITTTNLEQVTFYESLGFLDHYYDLEDYASHTNYYPKFD